MIFLDQPPDFRLRDFTPNVPLGRINQELRHAQMIDILQADGDAPIARSMPDLRVGVVFELGKDIPCGFRRTYSFMGTTANCRKPRSCDLGFLQS